MRKMDCFAHSVLGTERVENKDQFLIADLVKTARIQTTSLSYDEQAQVAGQSHGKVMLVADGVGGHTAGNRASTIAVDEMITYMVDRMKWHALHKQSVAGELEAFTADLARSLEYCQQRIQNEADCCPEKRGMATTLTVAIVDWPTLHVVHAGNSRCYRYRNGVLEQLTRDHTLVRNIASLDQPERVPAPTSQVLWNVVGGESAALQADVRHQQLQVGDTILLCTDGLTKFVSDKEIQDLLDKDCPARSVCEDLIHRARNNGGIDNTTVAVARFLDAENATLESAHDSAADSIEACLTSSDQDPSSSVDDDASVFGLPAWT